MKEHRAVKFQVREIPRSMIAPAKYNPRIMPPHILEKLKAKLAEVGLLEPLVWNERTGRLVAGHQRLKALDELAHGKDYLVPVAVVDLDEQTEQEMVIFMNNPEAQGGWDWDMLHQLLAGELEVRVDWERAGFEAATAEMILGPEIWGTTPTEALAEGLEVVSGLTEEDKERLRQMKQRVRHQRIDARVFLVVYASSRQELEDFLVSLGLPQDTEYVSVEVLRALLLEGKGGA